MKKFLKGVVIFLVVAIVILLVNNTTIRLKYNSYEENKELSKNELEDVLEAQRLKKLYGDRLLKGFAMAEIPIVVYNDKYEFLIYKKAVENDFKEMKNSNPRIFIRKNNNAQAFAVKLADKWGGSMLTLYTYNERSITAISKEAPFIISRLIPLQFVTIKRDMIPAAIIHEMVHAYFGNKNENKLNKAERAHKYLDTYPNGGTFEEKWNEEGKALYNALNTKNKVEKIKFIKEFLKIRDSRRKDSKLSLEFVETEKLIEWEEGLGKYSEIKIYDYAAKDMDSPRMFKYKDNKPYWKNDFKSIGKSLGSRDGDYRFYLSGMAQALLLDELSDKWKDNIHEDGVYLEDKLRKLN